MSDRIGSPSPSRSPSNGFGTASNVKIGSLPCFTKTVTKMFVTSEYPSYLPFPKVFYHQHASKLGRDVTLKLSPGKKWQLRLGPVKNDTFAFRGAGWIAFVKDNELKVGDKVMFTMLSGSVFCVKIIRGSSATTAAAAAAVPEKDEQPKRKRGRPPSGHFSEFKVKEEEDAGSEGGNLPVPDVTPVPKKSRKRPVEEEHEDDEHQAENATDVHRENVAASSVPGSIPGTAENPFVIDLSSGPSRDGGLHLVLKTGHEQGDKEFRLFISATVIEKAGAAGAAPAAAAGSPSCTAGGVTYDDTTTPCSKLVENDMAAKATSSSQAKPPKLTIPIKASNIDPYWRVAVNKEFAAKWLPPNTTVLTMIDDGGIKWSVKWNVNGKKWMLSQGWRGFAKHHKLTMGDRFVLEVINSKTLKVTVCDQMGRPKLGA